ncbi:MAG: hypothetical protein KDA65_00030 [Planctomycetaceae bacterium]|nr:hypothetical protein [Planctomycetaceae bacterium]
MEMQTTPSWFLILILIAIVGAVIVAGLVGLVFVFCKTSPVGRKRMLIVGGICIPLSLLLLVFIRFSAFTSSAHVVEGHEVAPDAEIRVGLIPSHGETIPHDSHPLDHEHATVEVTTDTHGVVVTQKGPNVVSVNSSHRDTSRHELHLKPQLDLILIFTLLLGFVFLGFLIWLLYRSDRFRAVALALMVGGVLFVALFSLKVGFVAIQTLAMDATATVSSSTGESVVTSHPADLQDYIAKSSLIFAMIAGVCSLIFAFAMYVYFVSRKQTVGVKSSRFLQSTLWALPVVLISGIVLLKYMDHLHRSIHTSNEIVTPEGIWGQIDPDYGGFAADRVLEVNDDLPLVELEQKVAKLPTDLPANSEEEPTEAAAAAVELPAVVYPEWITKGEDVQQFFRDEGKVFRFTVMSDLYESNAAAIQDAMSQLSQKTTRVYQSEMRGSVLQEIPEELLRDSAIIHTYGVAGLVSTEQSKFPMYRVWLDCEVSTGESSVPFQYWKGVMVQHRMWTLASLIGFFVLVFVSLSVLFRLNHFSKGQFERRLKLAYIILILVAGFGVMSLIA